jgi:hypothetical protein
MAIVLPSAALGQVQVQGGGVIPLGIPLGGMVPDAALGADGSEPIGDPWWDDAAAVKAPAPAAAKQDGKPVPANDPQAMRQLQLQLQAQQLGRHARQPAMTVLRRELSLVRQTCPSLEPQQRAAVLHAGREAVEAFAKELMGRTPASRRVAQRQDDAAAKVHLAVQAAVAANASQSEAAAYEAERGRAVERRRQAAVAVLVAEVERDAFLDDAERGKLAAALAESYREPWRSVTDQFQQMGRIVGMQLPEGFDRCVEQVLGKDRQAEWLRRRGDAQPLVAGRRLDGSINRMPVVPLQGGGLQLQRIENGVRIRIENGAVQVEQLDAAPAPPPAEGK